MCTSRALYLVATLLGLLLGTACGHGPAAEREVAVAPTPLEAQEPPPPMDPKDMTEEQWKARLSPLQYRITRLKETERPGTGEYLHTKTEGTYRCVCCGLELFESDAKYDSGCGWPSFYDSASGNVDEEPDTSHGMVRTEILCRRCGAHLGHVFPDGPAPTGRRFCVNSASLRLDAEKPSDEPPETPPDDDTAR